MSEVPHYRAVGDEDVSPFTYRETEPSAFDIGHNFALSERHATVSKKEPGLLNIFVQQVEGIQLKT